MPKRKANTATITEGRPLGKSLLDVLCPSPQTPLHFTIPYGPSVNTYWRSIGRGRVLISERGREYRKAVVQALALQSFTIRTGLLSFRAVFYPPDRRRRDLDNVLKAVCDSLKHAGVYLDDSQIRHFDVRFGRIVSQGAVQIALHPFTEDDVDA